MKTNLLLFVCIIAAMNIYAQSTVTYRGHNYKSQRVSNKTYLRSEDGSMLINKGTRDNLDVLFERNKTLNPERISLAHANLRVTTSNADMIRAIKTVFSDEELSKLKNETLGLILRINGKGDVISVTFTGLDKPGSKLGQMDLSKFSALEDKLMSTLKFNAPDPGIYVYTYNLPLRFGNVVSNGYVFPEKAYLNP